MKKSGSVHVLNAVFLNLLFIIIIFSCDNPLDVGGIFLFAVTVLAYYGSINIIFKGMLYFVPFAVITVIINLLFVYEGHIILFSIAGKKFTLEALIYALLLAFKLLLIIYVFEIIKIMIDSDTAASYFSYIIPKSTLLMMISFKLFPTMRSRLKNLKDIYAIRGVDFNNKTLKGRIGAYIPILSVLLESSLEDSFDIGEAAYVRGFLSGKRTIYEKQKFNIKDSIMMGESIILIISYIFLSVKSYLKFDIYNKISVQNLINFGSATVFIIISSILMSYILIDAA